ncbi:MAG: PAS domain-containing sensor histidine kinase [Anaerolineae bacterium]|nr:PAS domain-containing sensor histidine kinase [Anaerolineae bacterium]
MTTETPKTEQALRDEIEALRTRINTLEAEKLRSQRLRQLDSSLTSSVLDYLPDFVYVKDLDGSYVFNNVAHARSIGVENPIELVGKSDFDFFTPELATQYWHDEQQIIQSGQPLLNREERSIGVDGTPIWALTSKVLLRDEQDQIVGLLGITRDISQRRQIQDKLAARETEYRLVINTMTDGIVLQDAHGKIVSCNPSAERILGLTEPQLLGLTSIDPRWRVVHEDGSPFLGDAHPAMITLQTGKPQSNVIMGIHKPDGSLSWITASSRPLIGADSDKPYAVVVNFTDITALKTAEHQLRESEERFRELAATIDVVFALYSYAERRPLYISPAYEKIWGRDSAALFETPASFIDAVHADDRARVLKAITAGKLGYEYRIVKPEGDIRWIRTQSFPIRDVHGEVVRIADISEDVTEHKRIAAEQQRAETLRTFLADASHDLHTPLAVATTSVYLLRRLITDKHPIDEQLKYVDMLGARIEHIRKQLDDMFTLVRLDLESAFEFKLEDINEIVQIVHAQTLPAATNKQHQFTLALGTDLPSVLIDTKEIHRAIGSLVDNAIAYTSPQGSITIRTGKRDNFVLIEVEDTGIGIAEEHLERIFDRFYRVDDARNTSFARSGLGLTIAEKIIEAHNGIIHVKSEVDKGSVFTIALPLPAAGT